VLDGDAPERAQSSVSDTRTDGDPAIFCRRLLRTRERAALATSLRGAPYASLVLVTADLDASLLLLLSGLAEHSRNIALDPRISLLLDATEGHADPLTGPRITLLGRAEAIRDPRCLARFTAHHPASSMYSGFGDFRLYRVIVDRAHLVAGFGQIRWIEGHDLILAGDVSELAAAEPGILAHMNEDHADVVVNYARHLLGREGADWRMTGIDPEGIDLRCGSECARIDFAVPVHTAEEARAVLVQLAANARK
jgi:heme oxygenase (biliverdin-IX-beta and delta-forming)